MTAEDIEIAIVGAGLSGLALAERLTAAGRRVAVLEARGRIGGRILSLGADGGPGPFDLGPAWIWQQNRRMRALAGRLGLGVFAQHAEGRLVFQNAAGAVRRDLDMAPMAGALRIAGGLGQLCTALAARLAPGALRLGHAVGALAEAGSGVRLTGTGPHGPFTLSARHAVLALPPRLAARLRIEPALPAEIGAGLAATPTWMAGHAKLVAIYAAPFWRAHGLSGDAISHAGPLAEVHDASAPSPGPAALFGFVATPPALRAADPGAVDAAAAAQLAALFGAEAARPLRVLWHDWATDAATATAADLNGPATHPAYGRPPALDDRTPSWLHFAGTELAAEDGGFLEGALASAEAAAHRLANTA